MRWLALAVLLGMVVGCASQGGSAGGSPGLEGVEQDAESAHRELERETAD